MADGGRRRPTTGEKNIVREGYHTYDIISIDIDAAEEHVVPKTKSAHGHGWWSGPASIESWYGGDQGLVGLVC